MPISLFRLCFDTIVKQTIWSLNSPFVSTCGLFIGMEGTLRPWDSRILLYISRMSTHLVQTVRRGQLANCSSNELRVPQQFSLTSKSNLKICCYFLVWNIFRFKSSSPSVFTSGYMNKIKHLPLVKQVNSLLQPNAC